MGGAEEGERGVLGFKMIESEVIVVGPMCRYIGLMLALTLVLSGCIGSGAVDYSSPEFNGTEYKQPVIAPDFTLVDQHGENFTLSNLEEKVVVIAFTYTHCPDICLAVENNLGYLTQNLGPVSNDVVLISITIDPARDTVERLANWTDLKGFDWPHLTDENHSNIARVWSDWHLFVDNDYLSSEHDSGHSSSNNSEGNTTVVNGTNNSTGEPGNQNESEAGGNGEPNGESNDANNTPPEFYEVGHSTVTFILDKNGYKRVAWKGSDWNVDKFLEDIVTLVNE